MAIKGSIYLLPDRATFISQIGETGARLSCFTRLHGNTPSLQPVVRHQCWQHADQRSIPTNAMLLLRLRFLTAAVLFPLRKV